MVNFGLVGSCFPNCSLFCSRGLMMLVHDVRHLEVEAPQVVFLDSPVEFWGTKKNMMRT